MYVEGRLQTRSWEDPEGKKRYRTEVVAREMIVLGQRRIDVEPSGSIGESEEEFPF